MKKFALSVLMILASTRYAASGQAESARQTAIAIAAGAQSVIQICAIVENNFQINSPDGSTITLSSAQRTSLLARYDTLIAQGIAALQAMPSSGNL